jgi:putative tricarboxylic transport membrane protein
LLEALSQALNNFGQAGIWFWILVGSIWGIVFGIVPGISVLTALAICLPFVFKMDAMSAMPLIVAIAATGFTGGSISSILLGIPGEAASAATILDGFPMNKKGEGARAIGAALMSSLLGGVAPVILALGMLFAVVPLVMNLTSAEMVFIILIGLAFLGVMGRGSMLKGLISGGIGLLLSCFGLATATGEPRFTFGNVFLYDGIHMIPVAMGLFAIPPMVELALQKGGDTLAQQGIVFKGMKQVWLGAKDVFHHKGLWLRSSLIGYIFGVIPGVGASGSVFVAYGQAKATSKHPELFGTGIVEGVIAPESCNNAKESGSLLTTMALGIPAHATGALELGAFMILGFKPGPTMIRDQLDIALTLLIAVAVANVIGAAICFPMAPTLAKLARVPGRILVPTVIALVMIGSYLNDGSIEDILVTLIFGAVGIIMWRFGFNAPALLLGFILGRLLEEYLFLSIQIGGPLFFLRPICIFLILCLVAFFVYGPLKRLIKRRPREVQS